MRRDDPERYRKKLEKEGKRAENGPFDDFFGNVSRNDDEVEQCLHERFGDEDISFRGVGSAPERLDRSSVFVFFSSDQDVVAAEFDFVKRSFCFDILPELRLHRIRDDCFYAEFFVEKFEKGGIFAWFYLVDRVVADDFTAFREGDVFAAFIFFRYRKPFCRAVLFRDQNVERRHREGSSVFEGVREAFVFADIFRLFRIVFGSLIEFGYHLHEILFFDTFNRLDP